MKSSGQKVFPQNLRESTRAQEKCFLTFSFKRVPPHSGAIVSRAVQRRTKNRIFLLSWGGSFVDVWGCRRAAAPSGRCRSGQEAPWLPGRLFEELAEMWPLSAAVPPLS